MTRFFVLPLLFGLLGQLFTQSLSAQSCSATEQHEWMMRSYPEYKAEMEELEDFIYQFINEPDKFQNNPLFRVDKCEQGRVYTIPVVVHVIHLGEAVGSGTNITDQRIRDAINAMNDRFLNVSGQSTEIEIRFELAKRAPDGSPTNAINRVNGSGIPLYQTEGIAFSNNGGADMVAVKSLSTWPRAQYYNIWVVNKIKGGYAGYANYPTTYQYEGTVMAAAYMTASSTTLTHELGHAFNLRHTFEGDGDGATCPGNDNCATQGDLICDTPPHRRNECGTTSTCGTEGIYTNSRRNYMSYCGGTNLFTPGQKDRAKAALFASTRFSLVESDALKPINPGSELAIIDITRKVGADCSDVLPAVKLVNLGSNAIDSVRLKVKIGTTESYNIDIRQTIAPGDTLLTVLEGRVYPPGDYELLVEMLQVNGNSRDEYPNNDFVCGIYQQFNNAPTSDLCHNFESGSFGLDITTSADGNVDPQVITLSGCAAQGSKVVAFRPYNLSGPLDPMDEMIFKPINLNNPDGAVLLFDRAYGLSRSPNALSLRTDLSVDCGQTFSTLFNKTAEALATTATPYWNDPYVPANCSHWKTDTMSLDTFQGKEALVRFQFVQTTGGAQNIYLDNICVKNKYQVSADVSPAGSGTVQGAGIFIDGSNINLTASPQPGFEFVEWREAGAAVGSALSLPIAVNARRNLTAVFRSISTSVRAIEGLSAQLYPNPAKQMAYLNIQQTIATDLQVSVRNILGQQHQSFLIPAQSGQALFPIDVSDLASGLYLIEIQAKEGIRVLKLIVE
jgi:hypothetical protein